MVGYKITNKDMTCLGFQYELNKIFVLDGELKICEKGFHFCKDPKDCIGYYDFSNGERFFEIEALGVIIEGDIKFVTDKIIFKRELTKSELYEIFSDEKFYNKGSYNIGKYNTGNYNIGYYNVDNHNVGYCNKGDGNIGDYNIGTGNKGNFNIGKSNIGDDLIGIKKKTSIYRKLNNKLVKFLEKFI